MKTKQVILGVLIIFGLIVLAIFLVSQSWVGAGNVFGPTLSEFFGFGSEPEPPPVSPHRTDISISFVSLGEPESETETYLELSSSVGPEHYTNVTGWAMVTERGTFRIPEARDFSTAEGVTGDIFLRGGSTLTIYANLGENRRISNDAWAVWLDADFLQFPHGTIVLYDDQSREVETYEY